MHSHRALFGSAIQQLQLVQESKYIGTNISKSATNHDKHIFEPSPGAELDPISRLVCGGIAGITSVFLTYPLDIVRTRLSIQTASFAELGKRPDKLPGMWETMRSMYKSEGGTSALYRGILPTVAGVAPYVSTAIYLMSYSPLKLTV